MHYCDPKLRFSMSSEHYLNLQCLYHLSCWLNITCTGWSTTSPFCRDFFLLQININSENFSCVSLHKLYPYMIIWNDSRRKFYLPEISTCTCISFIILKNLWNFFKQNKIFTQSEPLTYLLFEYHLLISLSSSAMKKKNKPNFVVGSIKLYHTSRDMVCCSTYLILKLPWQSLSEFRTMTGVKYKINADAKGTFFNYSTFHLLNST